MKKVLSLGLALLMLVSLSMVAFAATGEPDVFGTPVKSDFSTVVNDGDRVDPGSSIYIPINDDAAGMITTSSNMDLAKVNAIFSTGKSLISSYGLVKKSDGYYYEIKLKSSYGITEKDLYFTLNLMETGSTTNIYDTLEMDLSVGHATSGVLSGGDATATIYNSAPITEFGDDVSSAELYFGSSSVDFSYSVGINDQDTLNLYVNNDVDKDLLLANADASDVDFINFPATPTFDFSGTVTINSDKPYLYENKDGKLYTISGASYDSSNEEWIFKTNKLTSYVLSDTKLTSTTSSSSSSSSSSSGTTSNPETGSGDAVGVAVALAVVSLAAAGAVAFKKIK